MVIVTHKKQDSVVAVVSEVFMQAEVQVCEV